MADTAVEIDVLQSLSEIDPADWDTCAGADNPFVTHRFLKALEDSGSIGPGTGWQPHYMRAHVTGQTIAVAPMYGKSHSQGEYIFDHNFAHAYENAGGRYYPKLQIAVPFTPATGRRFLTHPDFTELGRRALIQGAMQLAGNNDISSLHITFCTQDEAAAAADLGLLHRTSQQFHWVNNGYQDFDNFLTTLSSRKRKNIRKERAQAQGFGGRILALTGDDLLPHHWDAFWQFYQDTGARKWGTPYLTRDFFDRVQQSMRDDVVLVLAEHDGEFVAGALNFVGRNTLFGRYWGCVQDHPCLHFELCYYTAIDFAIEHGLDRVEAGAQGSHKLARGYMPMTTHSLHWFADTGFNDAVAHYLQAERDAVDQDIKTLTRHGPFKKFDVGDRQDPD